MTNSATAATPPVERQIVRHMLGLALKAAPVLLIVAAFTRGAEGAASVGYALGLVSLNFMVSAALLAWATRLSPGATMAAVLGGFLVRMVLIGVALAAVHGAGWIDPVTLAVAVVATHLGLLIWEARYLSISFAFPALKPRRGDG